MKFDYLIDIFSKVNIGDSIEDISPENILQRYTAFPNEALYMIDYKHIQMEPLTSNFHKITGVDLPHHNEVTTLYEHVHGSSLKPFLNFTEKLLRYGFERTRNFVEEKDYNISLYRTVKNQVILKSTTILQYDTNGNIRYSLGKLMDVSGLIPYYHFAYQFAGPTHKQIYLEFNDLIEFHNILSKKEIRILKLTGMGLQTSRIADELHISKHTVDTHKRNIIKKLEASNSIDAYNKAKELGLF